MNKVIRKLSTAIMALAISASSTAAHNPSDKEKMKPEEVVAKHLEAVGTQEARSLANQRVITGTAVVTFRQGGKGQLQGDARLVSEGEKSLISMTFSSIDYPHEKLGFDGTKLTVSQVRPGVRTILGRYLLTNEWVFKEGLMGGALSSAWPLANLAAKNAKLQHDGIKKVNNRQLHQLKYSPKKGSSLKVNLFFDPETFQHVRTHYQQTLDPNVAASRPGDSVGQEETRVNIIEEFSDFKAESGLNLPHTYKLTLEIIGPSGSVLYDWVLSFQRFAFTEPVDAKEFNVDLR
ncbi:MAG TPA: hypothetical protein VF131_10645 [Blastocatellia bacterium]|nr:hypothetical protein [Blastocatellia bacterium]